MRYSILFFGSLMFLILTCSGEPQYVVIQEQVTNTGSISQSPNSIRENCMSDPVVDFSHFSSDIKYCVRKQDSKHEQGENLYNSYLKSRYDYFFLLAESIDYYVFGLRKIVI